MGIIFLASWGHSREWYITGYNGQPWTGSSSRFANKNSVTSHVFVRCGPARANGLYPVVKRRIPPPVNACYERYSTIWRNSLRPMGLSTRKLPNNDCFYISCVCGPRPCGT